MPFDSCLTWRAARNFDNAARTCAGLTEFSASALETATAFTASAIASACAARAQNFDDGVYRTRIKVIIGAHGKLRERNLLIGTVDGEGR